MNSIRVSEINISEGIYDILLKQQDSLHKH